MPKSKFPISNQIQNPNIKFEIKKRVGDKPLLVVVPDVAMAKKYLEWNATLDNLAKKYWPGALTIVGKCRKKIFGKNLVSGAVGKDNTVAVRVTAHPFLKLITEKLGVPLVATSANLADAGEIYDSAEAIKIFANLENAPDAIVDAGVLPKNLPSTIVSVVDDNIKVLRQGSVRL